MLLSGLRLLWPLPGLRGHWLRQSRPDNCVQTVLAMALGVPTHFVEREAATDGALTVGQTVGLLATFGVECRRVHPRLLADFWPEFYRMSGGRRMRALAFAFPPDGAAPGHAYFIVGRRIYDPASGDIARVGRRTLGHLDLIAILPEGLEQHPETLRLRELAA